MKKVVTFYSFKGGAGRTVCSANVAHFVAKERKATAEKPLLLVDMDLDSAGLTIMLDHYETYKNSECSATQIATGEFEVREYDKREVFLNSLKDVPGANEDAKSVRFLGGQVSSEREFVLEATGGVRSNMRNFLTVCDEEGISTVLLDSASGRQEIAQICHDLSDVIVYCCRLTRQFIQGTKWNIESFMRQRKRRAREMPSVIIYPVAVPRSKGNFKGTYERAMAELQYMVNTVKREGASRAQVVEPVLEEVESFKWEESMLSSKSDPTSDEQAALASYRSLANAIVTSLND